MKSKKKKKGFTLIELLVVIAIIGILSSIVFFAMRGATDRAKDSKIISVMSQLRSFAEMYYNDNNASFANFCQNAPTSFTDWNTIMNEIDNNNGDKAAPECHRADNGSNYCIKVQLNSGNWWCVDSGARSKQYSSTFSGCAADGEECE